MGFQRVLDKCELNFGDFGKSLILHIESLFTKADLSVSQFLLNQLQGT